LQVWNVKKILDWTINFFKVKNIPQPRLSSELLLSAVLNLSRMQLYLKYDYVLTQQELKEYKKFIIKRLEFVPIQHILREAYFRNIKLYVDENVLIPRPETELLVDRALHCIKEIYSDKKFINILEIGVGSGAISISMASEIDTIPEGSKEDLSWHLVATDKSSSALKVAMKNAKNILSSNKLDNIKFTECDIIPENDPEFIKKYKKNINLIISNPPYIQEKDYQKLPREIIEYEPKNSLLAGESGLEVYQKIFSKIKPFMSPDLCYIVFETDPKISNSLKKLAEEQVDVKKIEIEKDYNQRDRVLTIKV